MSVFASENDSRWVPLYAGWTICLASTLGSFFFSEVMGLVPCVLCWYQRTALFPLVPIVATGILLRDTKVTVYAFPFVLVGLGLATYQNLLYFGVISESLVPCAQGLSCKSQPIEWFGFITIPLLSLLAFMSIAGCLLIFHLSKRKVQIET